LIFNIIVCSFNRAMQCNALLDSLKLYFEPIYESRITVIYKAHPPYEAGYEKLKIKFPFITFTKETNFKTNIIEAIDPLTTFTMFIMDDDIFINKVSINHLEFNEFVNNQNVATLSLRLCPKINYCYTRNKPMALPWFEPKPILTWTVKNQDADWGYKHSLDGDVFRTYDIINRIYCLDYNHPNYLENVLNKKPMTDKPLAICYQESRLVNIPCNRVQTVSPNLFGQRIPYTEEILNLKFLAGEVIDIKKVKEHCFTTEVNAPHMEMPLYFIRE
jgi:hypothetical protein